jgi:lipopolysaccharide export LptBFGC system permease protein LptF
MKLLDRYVLWGFIRNYLLSFFVLIGLYIVLDMVISFDELSENHGQTAGIAGMLTTISNIASYYFYQSFLFFLQLSGIIPVVAAAFTLMRMSRFNELTAILAAGVPLLRVATPIILCGVVINFVLLPIDQEIVIPRLITKVTRSHDEIQEPAATKKFPIKAMLDDNNSLFNAGLYTPPVDSGPARIEVVDIIERDDQGRVIAHTLADHGEWDASRSEWRLTNGFRVTGLQPEERRGPRQRITAWPTKSITPEEIALYKSGDHAELLSTERVNALLERPKSYGTVALMRVKHFRWAQMIINVVLLLLAIPCCLTREPGQLKRAATKCLLLTGACMGSIFIARHLAGNPPSAKIAPQWPLIMAWVPIFLFLPLAIYLLDRTHTKGT